MNLLELARLMLPPTVKQLDSWQGEVLLSPAPENFINVHRQCGKTTIVGTRALTVAITEEGSLILIFSASYRQSQEMGRGVKLLLERYRDNLQRRYPDVHVDLGLLSDTKGSFELSNHSRIICLPPNPDTIRVYSSPRMIIFDEASRIPDALYLAVRPMVFRTWTDPTATPCQIFLLSTPFGQHGFFYEESKRRAEEGRYHKWQHTIEDSIKCGRATRDFANAEKRKGDDYYQQEWMCNFLGGFRTLFNQTELDSALVDEAPFDELYKLVPS